MLITPISSIDERSRYTVAANKTFQIAARVTEEEKDNLIEYCEKNELNMAQVIRKAVKEYLENHKED